MICATVRSAFGWAIKKLNEFAKVEFGLHGGIGARFPIDTSTGTLQFHPNELRLTARATSAAEIGWAWPLKMEGKLTGNLLGTWHAADMAMYLAKNTGRLQPVE